LSLLPLLKHPAETCTDLVQGLGDIYYSTSAGQRERMLAATERLQKTTDRLAVGKQQLAETEVRHAHKRVLSHRWYPSVMWFYVSGGRGWGLCSS